jgi:hypothetical protein
MPQKLMFMILSLMVISMYGMERPVTRAKTTAALESVYAAAQMQEVESLLWQTLATMDSSKQSIARRMHDLDYQVRYGCNSSEFADAICDGHRVDIEDQYGHNVFHLIASYCKSGAYFCATNPLYIPKQNLLSTFALPEYQSYRQYLPALDEAKAKGSKERVLTVLLCLNRSEMRKFKTLKWYLLARLIDDIYNQPLFARVFEHAPNPMTLAITCPFRFFQETGQSYNGADREKFVKKCAPLIAWYRLQIAQVLISRNARVFDGPVRTAYQVACHFREVTRLESYLSEVQRKKDIAIAQEVADMLEPEGFIDRHMPDCTRLVENLLLDKDPFDGFEFK